MGRRRLPCDVPGCPCERALRWHRVCPTHFTSLPWKIRDGLMNSHRTGDKAAQRDWKRQAAAHDREKAEGATPRISGESAFQRAQRLLGERDTDWSEAAE